MVTKQLIRIYLLNESFEYLKKKVYRIQICFFPVEKFGSEKRFVLSHVGGYVASCEMADLICCN